MVDNNGEFQLLNKTAAVQQWKEAIIFWDLELQERRTFIKNMFCLHILRNRRVSD